MDLDYGNSVRNNLAQTVLNPQAGLTNTPATGLSPTAAVNEKALYDKGFTGEEKKAHANADKLLMATAVPRSGRGI